MPSSPQRNPTQQQLPLLKPPPSPGIVKSAISETLAIPAKIVGAVVTNPVGTVKHAASFLFGPGLFCVLALLTAVAWLAVKSAAIADTKIFKTFLGQSITPDAQWQSRLDSVEDSMGAMFGFCFYSFITGTKILNEKWANYSAAHVGGNASDIKGFDQGNREALLSEKAQLEAMQRAVEEMDHPFFQPPPTPRDPSGAKLAGDEQQHHTL